MAKKRRTKAQRKLIAILMGGGMLRVQKSDPPYFIDGGDTVNARTVRCLVRDGVLKAAEDGLLPGDTQTFVLA